MEIKNKKKVLFLITKSNWGGAQRYVYDLATNLDYTKFAPVVALGGTGTLSDMLKNADVRVISIASLGRDISIKNELVFMRELYHIIKAERPSVLHVNSSKAGGIGAFLGRLLHVPHVIFTAHGWAFNEDRPTWQKLPIKYLHWMTILLSHRTIAVSNALVTQMDWPGAQRKMKIINPGRTIGPMYTRREARAKIIDFCPRLTPYINHTWLVTIAELHPIKRHHILIDTISTLLPNHPNLRLILIGEGSERTAIEKQIEDLDLTNHVFLLGNIVEAARFLKAFDIFVLASKSESYGYVLHEAGLARVPVVATNVGGIPDIITSGQTGLLVPPDNIILLAKAIEKLLTDHSLPKKYAAALFIQLSARNVVNMAQTTQDLYIH